MPGIGSVGGRRPAAHVTEHEMGATCGVFSSKKMTRKERCQSMLCNRSAKARDMSRSNGVMSVERLFYIEENGGSRTETVLDLQLTVLFAVEVAST
jgi:hypothetical protein